jgi:hypothetical protein
VIRRFLVGESRTARVKEATMQDLIYVAVMVAFFAIAGLFIFACDKIIGSDEVALAQGQPAGGEPEPFEEKVAA